MHACANNEVRAQRRIRRDEAPTAGGAGAAAPDGGCAVAVSHACAGGKVE